MKPHLTLLVVDDDAGMRAWLAAFAAEQGWAVECAGSGEQGLELFRKRTPDLVTLDLSLPGIDGLATLRQFRALAPSVPVIMLSGVADTRSVALADPPRDSQAAGKGAMAPLGQPKTEVEVTVRKPAGGHDAH